MSDDGGMIDMANVNELVKKMHEEKGNTVDYLRDTYSKDQLAELNKEVWGEIKFNG